MLASLSISNFALIESVELQFDKGLNIITGETGAGKSILLGALGLVLGNRADLKKLQNRDKKCIIEAVFVEYPNVVNDLLASEELDIEANLTLRREINQAGKSRSFVNDTPVSLSILSDLASHLIDLNRQHEISEILDTNFHYDMIDALAGHQSEVADYVKEFKKYMSNQQQLLKLQKAFDEDQKQREFLQFQYNELETAQINKGELEDLETSLKLLQKSEDVVLAQANSAAILIENEQSIESQVMTLVQQWRSLSDIGKEYETIYEQLVSVLEEIRDLASNVSDIQGSDHSGQNIEEVNERLDTINKLCQKHRVNSEEELLNVFDQMGEDLSSADTMSADIQQLEKTIAKQKETLNKQALSISGRRKKVFPNIEQEINGLLDKLSMKHAAIKVNNEVQENISDKGIDHLEILFSANKGSAFQSIKQVASGGERSRLMLCMKTAVADAMKLPSLIFDEIDTGVSGSVAGKMGEMLSMIAVNHQVITISHLAQVAARGSKHFNVLKEETKDGVMSTIKVLSGDERIVEIATMLSEDPPSKAAMENAKELLSK